MRTRSSSNLPVESSPNSTTFNPKHRNCRRSKKSFILRESPVDTIVDECTMAALLRVPTEGQSIGGSKKKPHVLFSLGRILFPKSLMNSSPSRTTNLCNEISNFQQRFEESFHEAWDRYKDLLCACPHHGFTELHQLDTFYNALNSADQDSLNSVVGGNMLERRTQYVLTIIKNKSKCLVADGNTFLKLRDNIQRYVSAAAVNYNQGNSNYHPPGVANQIRPSGFLPSNTIANPKGELKAISTRSGIVLDEPFIPIPLPFVNLEEDEREMLKALLSNKEKLLEMVNTPLNENCSAVILKKLPEKHRDPGKFLIPCGFSKLKCKALADIGASINLMPLSVWKEFGLPELISTQMTLKVANQAICTPAEISRDVFVSTARALIKVYGEEMILRDDLNSTKDLHPPHNVNPLSSSTTTSSPNHLLEEFADELALIKFLPENDDLPYDIESNLKVIKYLLHYDPIKKMDSILKDLIDQSNLADLNENLVGTMPEMFTDKHALDYSSPPLYDEYDDYLFEIKSDTKCAYDDPFDSKGEKIKESKLLINEFDLPRSNKNVKKLAISHASLILENFDPPLYELPFFKEVLGAETPLSFSFENEEKVFKPEILTSKGVHSSFIPELYHRGYKIFKIIKIRKSPMEIFFSLMERTSASYMFLVSTSIPHERINSGVGSS
uniref:Reverse transcriptase domain-containing protein n=1 Tax=Tanacetum cinerariifolium TaxID=118510 RepID=A0A6L2LD05_TANCI|nr:reverse transcriptase domain-containing protein [Tanacetum cinerariifolium]